MEDRRHARGLHGDGLGAGATVLALHGEPAWRRGRVGAIAFGVEGETNRYAGAQLCTAIDAGEFVAPAASGAVTKLETSAFIGHATNDADTVLDGLDIGYEITVEAETDGTIQAICFWTPISSDGAVVVGAGGVL